MAVFQHIRVKICGITRVQDALVAARLGADAIGLIFYPDSPRAVDVEKAADIVAALPPFVSAVGLFVNADPDQVRAVLKRVPLNLLQFHGEESPEYCAAFNFPYLKVARMQPDTDLPRIALDYAGAKALLLDTYVPDLAGGSGKVFDWSRVPRGLTKPIILAGGLTPENVLNAIATLRPYGVDVSSGVEAGQGIKDPSKIEDFIRKCRMG